MKVCVICSVPDLERFSPMGDAHLMLTHLIEPGNGYTQFYAGRKELKILDNGLFENHVATPTPEILQKAQLVGADVVIAPDVLFDPVGTVKNAEEFLKAVYVENGRRRGKGLRPLQVMAVPQAADRKGYLWCYDQLANKLGFEWIGLSILACPNSFGGLRVGGELEVGDTRIKTYQALKEAGLWNPKVNHHLLGLGSFVEETSFFAPVKEVVSNDSSSAYLHGSLGIRYEAGRVPGGKRKEKLDFQMAADLKNYEDIASNIQTWKKYASFELV